MFLKTQGVRKKITMHVEIFNEKRLSIVEKGI